MGDLYGCDFVCIFCYLVPGEWQDWLPWGLCSVTCGGGWRHRQRECNMTTHGKNTAPCVGESSEKKECHKYDCKPGRKWLTLSQFLIFAVASNIRLKIQPYLSHLYLIFKDYGYNC